MQSHIGNNRLRRVYYVVDEGFSLMLVPADRLGEVEKLRSEQIRRQVQVAMTLSGIRRG